MNYKTIIALLLFPSLCFAEDIYFAQSAVGDGSGDSCINADAIADLTWSATDETTGSIDPGDTLHLCGTISTAINTSAAGASGNPITVNFEDDSKMSTGSWNGPAIAVDEQYIVIDGGTNGAIECTDNGTALTNQDAVQGVMVTADNFEVKNLTITNLFIRTPSSNGAYEGNGVRIVNASNGSVHDITASYMNSSVYYAYGDNSNVDIYNITFTHGANGIVVGNSGATTLDDLKIYNNSINLYDDGSDSTCGNTFHNDGIQIFAQSAGSELTNLQVYGNTVGPEMGECTATTGWIFIEGYVPSGLIYNNLLLLRNGVVAPTNGFIYDKPLSTYSRGTEIYNNTIVSYGQAGTGVGAEEEGSIIKNNIFMNLNYAIYGSGSTTIDYNLYYNNGTNGNTDTNGVFTNPDLNADSTLSEGSPAIGAGDDLSADFTTDKAGNNRSSWDIGAYEYRLQHHPWGSGIHIQ